MTKWWAFLENKVFELELAWIVFSFGIIFVIKYIILTLSNREFGEEVDILVTGMEFNSSEEEVDTIINELRR